VATKTSATAWKSEIRDNGAGIPPEVKEKMFFTMKPAGEGTGLASH
jgi:C4-dicarboxylate-specific signal transduction histidine kinase